MDKKIYLGLDIGTNSCGFAVTNEKYELVRAKGKKLWGVRLFEDAKTATDCRTFRGARRRLDRRKLKLMWLREIFAEEINKIDPDFFARIKYSNLWFEDKQSQSLNSKDSLFNGVVNGKPYTDKDYYNDYPTIYHLRKELLETPAKDVRFLYLALSNMIKRRGNFLFDGELGDNTDICDVINKVVDDLNELNEQEFYTCSCEHITCGENLTEYIKKNSTKLNKEKLCEMVRAKDSFSKSVFGSIIDGKVNLKNFNIDEVEEEKISKFSFDDENFDLEIMPKLEEMLPELVFNLIMDIKSAYSSLQLKKILNNSNYLCEALVSEYEKHHNQLQELKHFIREFYPSSYYELFRSIKPSGINYCAYVNMSLIRGKKQIVNLKVSDKKGGGRTPENLYKYIKNIISKEPSGNYDKEKYEKARDVILSDMEHGEYLVKQRRKNNSIFPNKLYKKEMEKILQTNSNKFAFLNQCDSSGLTNSEKILQILEFRIPYFVGPIGQNKKGGRDFSWAKRVSNLELKPWTLEKIVDFDESEDNFISRMTNKCTYIPTADVLPKGSLLYSKFKLLNELNNLKINGDKISVQLKQRIFNDLFKNYKKVTVKRLKKYLIAEGIFSEEEENDIVIGGIDKEFANSYGSYITFKNIFGEEFVEKHVYEIENIIKLHTILSDKTRLKDRVKKENKDLFDDKQLNMIKALNFSGWGTLSYEFLCGLKFINKATGEVTCIIDELWNTNKNLQELLYDETYTLSEELGKLTVKESKEVAYSDIENLYCSPAVKRGVWQAVSLIKEIRDVLGKMPDNIFVEVTRGAEAEKGDAGRKLSRQTTLQAIYKSKEFIDSVKLTKRELENLNNQLNKVDNSNLRSEKLYLYFLQMGKCAYSGEPIDIQDLYNEHVYDVDHIIPRAKIKDDSLDNKVLVKSEYNKKKSDNYPIYSVFPDWVEKNRAYWEALLKLKLMSQSKFDRLTRKENLTDNELDGFIARQLVITNQTTKAVIELLKNMVENPRDIVYSKARFVSDFRKKYGILKCREVNDLHHAKDAYLNIVVGNCIRARFTDTPQNFSKTRDENPNKITMNTDKIFDYKIKSALNSNNIVWDPDRDIPLVKNTCSLNDCLVSKMSFSNMNGSFYDATVYKSKIHDGETNAKIPLKGEGSPMSNIERYGGYNSAKNAYFMVIESDGQKNKREKTIEAVPVYIVQRYKGNKEKIFDYIVKENKLENPKVILDKLNFHSTLKIGKGEYWLGGKSGPQYTLHNANQWHASDEDVAYVRTLLKYDELKENKVNLEEIDGKIIISKASKQYNTQQEITAESNEKLYASIVKQLSKDIYKGMQLETKLLPKLKELKDLFSHMTISKQADFLLGTLLALSTGAKYAKLVYTGKESGESVGKLTIGKNITNLDISLVIKSKTGLLQKTIKL